MAPTPRPPPSFLGPRPPPGPLSSPANSFCGCCPAQVCAVAELVHLKLLMLAVHQGRVEEAVAQVRAHLGHFRSPPGERETGKGREEICAHTGPSQGRKMRGCRTEGGVMERGCGLVGGSRQAAGRRTRGSGLRLWGEACDCARSHWASLRFASRRVGRKHMHAHTLAHAHAHVLSYTHTPSLARPLPLRHTSGSTVHTYTHTPLHRIRGPAALFSLRSLVYTHTNTRTRTHRLAAASRRQQPPWLPGPAAPGGGAGGGQPRRQPAALPARHLHAQRPRARRAAGHARAGDRRRGGGADGRWRWRLRRGRRWVGCGRASRWRRRRPVAAGAAAAAPSAPALSPHLCAATGGVPARGAATYHWRRSRRRSHGPG